MRTSTLKIISDPDGFKAKLLQWSQQYREVQYLDSNNHHQPYTKFDALLGVDAFLSLSTDFSGGFEELRQWVGLQKDWLLGYFSYDMKNDLEALRSDNTDGLAFPDLYFFQPKKLFILKGNELEISYLPMCDDEIESDFQEIESQQFEESNLEHHFNVKMRLSESEYLEQVQQMQQAIQRGSIYEANYCMEFYAQEAILNPLHIYKKLNAISRAPFAAYFKNSPYYLVCASPERYLQKTGNRLISQPIKGTSGRKQDPLADAEAATDLQHNEKERNENIMIVDLVRNDLSRTAIPDSVKVDELCGVYSFKQVHQLISTVSSEMEEQFDSIHALETTFPMGSMTGAPKISAMQIIEKLEKSRRGLYSGALGYFDPEGNFDFNVVIRSILYNAQKKYVSFSVGSAITSQADPSQEYQECLLKAKAMLEVLGVNHASYDIANTAI